jgi:hypothetical protein
MSVTSNMITFHFTDQDYARRFAAANGVIT